MSAPIVTGGIARMRIDDYAELLAMRAVPEWHFIDERTVEFDEAHLHVLGIESPTSTKEWTFNEHLFDYQKWIVEMALDRERFAVFAMTGTGKTLIQLDFAKNVSQFGRVLILAPLNICHQTILEAEHFYGDDMSVIDCTQTKTLDEWLQNGTGVAITNYEKMDGRTEPLPVAGLVLDESSVLKASMGSRRTAIIAAAKGLRWKLCCSATPAPNDRLEYAEHAYFLDVVRSTREFLAAYFVNRDGEWQLKRHGETSFYRHLASWSVFMRDPRSYHFEDHTMDLPPLDVRYDHIALTADQSERARSWESGSQSSLFGATPGGVTSRTKMMQIANGFVLNDGSIDRFDSAKPVHVARLANEEYHDEQVLIWVNFDEEGDALAELIPDAFQLSGKTPVAKRSEVIEAFAAGNGPRILIAKTKMFAHGLNLQSCRVMIFSSMTDSFEQWFQAIRRCHRYGQQCQVIVHVPLTGLDEAICQNVLSKESVFLADGEAQEREYIAVLRPADTTQRIKLMTVPATELDRAESDAWTLINGDCIAHMPTMDENSMDLAIFSPPFANLFTYSSAAGDMGNVRSDNEYRLQWEFFAPELLRIMKPGRICVVHTMDVIRFAGQFGHRHTYDYPSDLREGMERAGFIYRARIAIDKDPQVQAVRTKDQNLLFATLKRNALDNHPQASECLLIFTAPGDSEVPVIADDVSNQEWISWAHHVWYGIRATDVLNTSLGKEHDDERHICPLQLSLIERCVRLWSNKGETVFSPFAGIGSEGWEAIGWDRKFYGIELKRSYFETAARFLRDREYSVSNRMFSSDDYTAPEAIPS